MTNLWQQRSPADIWNQHERIRHERIIIKVYFIFPNHGIQNITDIFYKILLYYITATTQIGWNLTHTVRLPRPQLMKSANHIFSSFSSWCMSTQHKRLKGKSALFHICEHLDSHDWSVSLWLTGERENAIPSSGFFSFSHLLTMPVGGLAKIKAWAGWVFFLPCDELVSYLLYCIVYSHLAHSDPGKGFRSTVTLIRIKHFLKVSDF